MTTTEAPPDRLATAYLSARRRAARYRAALLEMGALYPHAGDCGGTRCPDCGCCEHRFEVCAGCDDTICTCSPVPTAHPAGHQLPKESK